jgi:multiple antibiotic resistance protein
MPDWSEFVKQAAGLFAIVDPIGVIGIFISLTRGQTVTERRRTATITCLTMTIVLVTAALIGEKLLWFFGIGIPAFQVGGGIIIILVALDMLNARRPGAKGTRSEEQEAEERDTVAVVPLAVPILAGPGAITTVIIDSHSAATPLLMGILIGIIVAISIFTWLVFQLAAPIGSRLGQTGLNIVTRLMGLILAAISVEIIATGLKGLFPALQ